MENKCKGCEGPVETDADVYCKRCNAYRDEQLTFLQKEVSDLLVYIEDLEIKLGTVKPYRGGS